MKVMFMGTPDFAAAAFECLCDAGFDVLCAVTQPDKPKGRGYAMLPPPVKEAAVRRGIPVFQPERLKDGTFSETLEAVSPDVIVVAAYGKILPEYILDFPKYGCVNIHASLLPRWRGAAPIQRCIMEGDSVTGVTTMLMDVGLDTGDILEAAETKIEAHDNFETVHNRLANLGGRLIVSTLNGLRGGTLLPKKQSDIGMTYASKIEREDCSISFAQGAERVHNTIRALCPTPLAFTSLGGKRLKLLGSRVGSGASDAAPGTVISLENGVITVSCGDGTLEITGVLPEGRKRISSSDFIRGRGISVGDILGG